MRTLKKSLLVLAGLFTPALASVPADAGVIPWVYDSIFGYGWGYGYGGMPYGGYGGAGYGGYPVSYAAPVYTTNYGPGYGYSVADSCCCDPCSTGCSTGTVASDCCTTAVQSAKPAAPEPTPVVTPVTPRVPVDEFGRPTRPGTGAAGTGAVGTDRANPNVNEEALPETERTPAERRAPGPVAPDDPDMRAPAPDDGAQGGRELKAPSDSRIAVRYVPTPTRSRIAVPSSVNRVVRIDRATREQLVQGPSKPQLAANP